VTNDLKKGTGVSAASRRPAPRCGFLPRRVIVFNAVVCSEGANQSPQTGRGRMSSGDVLALFGYVLALLLSTVWVYDRRSHPDAEITDR